MERPCRPRDGLAALFLTPDLCYSSAPMHTSTVLPARVVRTPGGLVFGARAVPGQQREILDAALGAVGHAGRFCAFDLDSTLLHNHSRQARIVREFGAERGLPALATCGAEQVVSWDLRDTLLLLGLEAAEVDAILPALRACWRDRFFTSDYCADDQPVAGASAYLEEALARGGRLVYLTGRDAAMEAGTRVSFARAGFPLPDGAPLADSRVQLWCKPDPALDDDAWKRSRYQLLAAHGGVACAFDNEPVHVNGYKVAFPGAAVVHLDTDHSGRPVAVRDDIPSVHDFLREGAGGPGAGAVQP
jgi:hypothetical protein